MKIGTKLSATVLLASLAGLTHADAFVSGSIGNASYKDGPSATSFEFGGGYSFNENFAASLTYLDLGNAEEKDGSDSVSVEASGFNLSLIGTLPLDDKFSMYAKIGYYSWDADLSVDFDGFEGSGTISGNDFNYGIGALYKLNENVALDVGYTAYTLGDDLDFDVNNLSFGVTYSF